MNSKINMNLRLDFMILFNPCLSLKLSRWIIPLNSLPCESFTFKLHEDSMKIPFSITVSPNYIHIKT